jgi:hypothetical protein
MPMTLPRCLEVSHHHLPMGTPHAPSTTRRASAIPRRARRPSRRAQRPRGAGRAWIMHVKGWANGLTDAGSRNMTHVLYALAPAFGIRLHEIRREDGLARLRHPSSAHEGHCYVLPNQELSGRRRASRRRSQATRRQATTAARLGSLTRSCLQSTCTISPTAHSASWRHIT